MPRAQLGTSCLLTAAVISRSARDLARLTDGTTLAVTGVMIKEVQTIDVRELATVSGGMQWEQFRPSENVEDRRGFSPRENRQASPRVAPLPSLVRTPGDLSSRAGLDDLTKLGRTRRR